MMRGAGLLAGALALGLGAGNLSAQQGWSVTLTSGYSNGIGDTFEGPGSLSATASVYRPISRVLDAGIELGYHGLGTTTTRLPDLYGPGSTYREDFSTSAWQGTIGVRLRPSTSRIRPYAGAGAGAYLLRIHDVIEVRDASGQPIPQYAFRQTDAELHPGVNAALGVDRLVSIGRIGVGVHVRWHGIIAASGIADFFSLSLGLALN
ncbi:MAG TPA: hypothetical protein VFM14_08715 [Gemmatimonadales bacterium]|nr:hypothetical protein [Gemmatimonadales bacterium]